MLTQEEQCTASSKDITLILDTLSECELEMLNHTLQADISMDEEHSYSNPDCHLLQPQEWHILDQCGCCDF